MPTHEIRPFAPEDMEAVLRIWEGASRVGHPFLTETFLAKERQKVRDEYMPAAATWILEHDGVPIGFIALIDDEVGALFVDPAHHRRGAGGALMDFAKGLRSTLELEVFRDNPVARSFYTRHGFVVISETRHEETGDPLLRMRYEPGV